MPMATPVPNNGLLQGLAEGLKQGLITYQTTKGIQHQQQMQELMSGVRQNADTGQLEYTPEKQAQIQAQGLLANRQADELDPNSQTSQRLGAARGALIHAANPKLSGDMFQGQSAADQRELEGLAKPTISGEYGLLKNLYNPLVGVKQAQMETAKDNQTAAAVDKVTKDDQLKSHTQRIQGANRILGQLDAAKQGKIVDTNQLLNDINTEYVALLTGANNPALGKQERTEYSTYAGNMAAVLQKIKGDPQSINSPAILQQLETQVKDLRGNYQGQIAQRAKLLQRTYKHNPDATAAQAEKIQEMVGQYGSPESSDQGGGLLQAPAAGPQDPVMAAKLKRLQELQAKARGG